MLKRVRLNNENRYNSLPTLYDMALQLIERGLELHGAGGVEFYKINTRQGNATTVFYFSLDMYNKFEGIKLDIEAGAVAKTGAGALSVLHIIMCLMWAGFEDAFPDEVKHPELEITNQDAELEERILNE